MTELKFKAIVKGDQEYTFTDGFMKHKDGTIIICVSKNDCNLLTSPIEPNTLRRFTGLKDKNDEEIYELDSVNLHLFTQVLGENLGVSEVEIELKGFICFAELGLAFKENENDEEYFYLFDAPGMLHEESFELIK